MSVYDKLISIANDNAGEDVSSDYPRTVTGALDALADVLAGEDVDAGHTITEAVQAVAQNIGGGGGMDGSCRLSISYDTSGLPVNLETFQVRVVNGATETIIPGSEFSFAPIDGYLEYDGRIPFGSCVFFEDTQPGYTYSILAYHLSAFRGGEFPQKVYFFEDYSTPKMSLPFAIVPNDQTLDAINIHLSRFQRPE